MNIFISMLIGIASAFLFNAIIAKFLPAKEKPHLYNFNIEKLKAKFKKLEFFTILSILISTAILIFIITKSMVILQSLFLNNKEVGAVYAVGLQWQAFVFPAVFISLMISGVIVGYFNELIGKRMSNGVEEWGAYIYDFQKRMSYGYEIDHKKLWRFLIIFVLLPAIAISYLELNYHLIITPSNISYHGIFSLKETNYSFNDIKKIVFTDRFKNRISGKIEREKPCYTIIMKEGFKIKYTVFKY
ncbi:hypothetical protein ACFL4C_00990 [Candidatus Omnitrophota bacterium]